MWEPSPTLEELLSGIWGSLSPLNWFPTEEGGGFGKGCMQLHVENRIRVEIFSLI